MEASEKVLRDSITSGPAEDEPKQVIEDTKEVESPLTEGAVLERWNSPKINLWRYLAANYCFILMGMNDAAYGVSLLPQKKKWTSAH
jgi:hypothetical protein